MNSFVRLATSPSGLVIDTGICIFPQPAPYLSSKQIKLFKEQKEFYLTCKITFWCEERTAFSIHFEDTPVRCTDWSHISRSSRISRFLSSRQLWNHYCRLEMRHTFVPPKVNKHPIKKVATICWLYLKLQCWPKSPFAIHKNVGTILMVSWGQGINRLWKAHEKLKNSGSITWQVLSSHNPITLSNVCSSTARVSLGHVLEQEVSRSGIDESNISGCNFGLQWNNQSWSQVILRWMKTLRNLKIAT